MLKRCTSLLCQTVSTSIFSENTVKSCRKASELNLFLVLKRYVGSSPNVIEKDAPTKSDLPFTEKSVTIYTCENLYDKWRKLRTFRTTPKSGVFANISYIDTFDDSKTSKPSKTIMCIHGIPGNYGVFSHLIKALNKEGFRVIVPTFPGELFLPGKYGTELFRHSVEEKTQVFRDFLKEIKVSELDCIIAHSSAIYPALPLVLDPELNVKCQVLFNTGGHKKPVTMKHYRTIWLSSQLYLTPWGKIIVQKTARYIMKLMRTPIRDDNIDGILLLAITMVYSQYWKTKEMFVELSKRKLPTLYCFSEDDKVVERTLSYEVVSLLGASKENVDFYDKHANLTGKGKSLGWLKLMSFEEGSHYVFRKHPEICNENVIDLLRRI